MKNSTITFTEILKILVDRKKITFKKIINLLKNFYAIFKSKDYIHSYPSFILIDPSNICTLRCPVCVESKKILPASITFLKKEAFSKVIDEISKYTLVMALYYAGEPFLNRDIFEMIKYGHKKKMYLYVSSNLNVQMDEIFVENLIDSGLDVLIAAVSGYTNEVYCRNHIGGDIELVKQNIKKIQEIKRKKKSKYPKLAIRYLLAKYNQKEKEDFYRFAAECGVDFFEVSLMNFIDKNNPETLHSKENETVKKNSVCVWPWIMLAIHSDGTTEPCCYYNQRVPILGNIFDKGNNVANIWGSDRLRSFRRKMALSGKNNIDCCKNCRGNFGYQRIIINDKYKF